MVEWWRGSKLSDTLQSYKKGAKVNIDFECFLFISNILEGNTFTQYDTGSSIQSAAKTRYV